MEDGELNGTNMHLFASKTAQKPSANKNELPQTTGNRL